MIDKKIRVKRIGEITRSQKRGAWGRDKKIESFAKKMIKNIIETTYDNTTITFIILKAISKGTFGAFLRKPTYYIDDPSEFLGEIAMFKQQRLEKKNLERALLRLQGYGIVAKSGDIFSLTKRGESLANKISGYKQRLEEKWDGKYRLVIFDIPEIYRHHRNWLRQELYFLGYKKLQNSVFVSKLSLTEDIIKEIKEREIENYVNYLLVEHIYDLKKGLFEIKK